VFKKNICNAKSNICGRQRVTVMVSKRNDNGGMQRVAVMVSHGVAICLAHKLTVCRMFEANFNCPECNESHKLQTRYLCLARCSTVGPAKGGSEPSSIRPNMMAV
jgi:hypothetical protein